ncbi:MAG TPA: protein kinase, partial [Rhodanobacteraceae bacterium]|nr:protein kinase [Rhodanobacteraceae bacterium]
MNAQRDDASVPEDGAADPLTSLRASVTAIADLAFGSSLETLALADAGGRHLALLTTDSLQLDLGDAAQRQFGDYELLEQIGEGGMGVVYRAHQRSLDRDVALKLLAAGPWASREFVERFRREAQHAARMQHPNIVAIHEVGSIEELHFFSMRLVRGGSLATLLKNGGALAPLR